MKPLEDRIKDKLEGYGSSLPETGLADFMAKFDGADEMSQAEKKNRKVLWLAPAAVAAVLVALLFIPRTGENPEIPAEVVSAPPVADNVVVEEDVEVQNQPKEETPALNRHYKEVQNIGDGQSFPPEPVQEVGSSSEEQAESSGQLDEESVREDAPSFHNSGSPYIPSGMAEKKRSVKINTAGLTAGIIGGASAVALAAAIPSILSDKESYYSAPTSGSGISDKRTGNNRHYMPLCIGASLRTPFNEKWSFVTGLEYSWYSSSIEYSLSGSKRQNAHYLGIPLRVDYTIFSHKVVDIYVGAGASADFCIAADLGGNSKKCDGVGFSLQGAGGIQFNLGKVTSLYIEPIVSWEIPSDRRVLDTYRTEHQVMFSVATGIRFSIPRSLRASSDE